MRRTSALRPRAQRAVTVAPAWGITTAPPRPGPLGRPGPWSEEAAEIERAYGPERTVHCSLEEFARTLTSKEETRERLREGGVPARELPARLAQAERSGEVAMFREAFRGFRAFDRPNVLHLFAGFRYDRPFQREFPEAVQVGPLWPARGSLPGAGPSRGRWVWYASPASAEAIAARVVEGLRSVPSPPDLFVRAPRPWSALVRVPGVEVRRDPLSARQWARAFRGARLRVVTGSRSLLEALEVGGPFLYFNGVLGTGPARRRHRPEKIVQLLDVARAAGWPAGLLSDLADFSRGRRVAPIVARAASAGDVWSRFPPTPLPVGFARGFEDAGTVLVRCARAFAQGGTTATDLVAETRRAARA